MEVRGHALLLDERWRDGRVVKELLHAALARVYDARAAGHHLPALDHVVSLLEDARERVRGRVASLEQASARLASDRLGRVALRRERLGHQHQLFDRPIVGMWYWQAPKRDTPKLDQMSPAIDGLMPSTRSLAFVSYK